MQNMEVIYEEYLGNRCFFRFRRIPARTLGVLRSWGSSGRCPGKFKYINLNIKYLWGNESAQGRPPVA